MRRIAVVLAGSALLVACSNDSPPAADSPPLVSTTAPSPSSSPTPSATPTEAPTAKIADTLCARTDQAALSKILKAPKIMMRIEVTPSFEVPAYDVCSFAVTRGDGRAAPLRIGASVLPATRADLATSRRAYDASQVRTEPVRTAAVGQGGYGTSRFVVFLGSGRLVKVSGAGSFAQSLAVAREIAKQTAGLPPAPLEITKPECDRAGVAAARVLGAPALIRRDRVNQYGDIECGWASATRAVSSTATRIRAADQFFERNSRKPGVEPLPLGDDGLYDPRTHAVQIRVGTDKVATFAPTPAGPAAKNDVIAFALRLSGLYTR